MSLDIRIRANADSVAKAWQKKRKQLEPILRKATAQATKVVFAESKRQMTELIYDKKVPTRKQVQSERRSKQVAKGKKTGTVPTGGRPGTQKGGWVGYKKYDAKSGNKPAWRRTGNLRRSERFRVERATLGLVVNDAKYARYRHDKKKTRFPAPWRKRAIELTRNRVFNIYRSAMRKAIRAGIVKGPRRI